MAHFYMNRCHPCEWVIDAKKIAEISENQANHYAREQIEETAQSTRDRRNAEMSKNSQQELQDFYGTSIGDNVLRAQQFLAPNSVAHSERDCAI